MKILKFARKDEVQEPLSLEVKISLHVMNQIEAGIWYSISNDDMYLFIVHCPFFNKGHKYINWKGTFLFFPSYTVVY